MDQPDPIVDFSDHHRFYTVILLVTLSTTHLVLYTISAYLVAVTKSVDINDITPTYCLFEFWAVHHAIRRQHRQLP